MDYPKDMVERVARTIVQARDTSREPQEWEIIAAYGEAEAALSSLPIAGLVEALEPFAKMGALLEGPFAPALFKDDQPIGMGGAWSENGEPRTITFGDLRRARTQLSLFRGEQEGERG